MRKTLLNLAALAVCTTPLSAQSVDSLVAKYIQASGGLPKIQALQSLRRTGRFTGGGGFEAVVVQENKRPSSVREEFSIQGMTGINAYDGRDGWKIEPWNGKRDPEALGEEEMHSILDDADFDGPLVNYQAKGNRVEFQGVEQIEGIRDVARRLQTGGRRLSAVRVRVRPQRLEQHRPLEDHLRQDRAQRLARECAVHPARSTPMNALLLLLIAQQPAVKVDSETISGLGARNIGSAAMSGRIAAIDAVHEGARLTIYVGSASGGVWKSTNGGTTFKCSPSAP